ncbi:hypothetical protein G6F35_017682 [Rhizopus arrhizus]|nr:hypothetical protein G6F35_017682 [Rhizopus arrhizus]
MAGSGFLLKNHHQINAARSSRSSAAASSQGHRARWGVAASGTAAATGAGGTTTGEGDCVSQFVSTGVWSMLYSVFKSGLSTRNFCRSAAVCVSPRAARASAVCLTSAKRWR